MNVYKVITHDAISISEPDFSLADATAKITEMASNRVDERHLWANVCDFESGALIYQLWVTDGYLHTWRAETNEEEVLILFF